MAIEDFSNLTFECVQMALEDFCRLGRRKFLKEWGRGSSRDYFVLDHSRQQKFDAKAILGAAHKFQNPILNLGSDYHGGDETWRALSRVFEQSETSDRFTVSTNIHRAPTNYHFPSGILATQPEDIESIEKANDKHESDLMGNTQIPELEKIQLIKARRGQGTFVGQVRRIEKQCRITGLSPREHLRASHIKPWRFSSPSEKLDGNNGLLLSPHVDHLFDRGYISFTDDGDLLVSRQITNNEIWNAWNINPKMNVGSFSAKQAVYLKFHRTRVFEK